jgi:hypothetical protein
MSNVEKNLDTPDKNRLIKKRTMKKNYLFAGLAAMMIASCSTDEQTTGGYVAGSTVTLNASLPNSGTRVSEAASDTYGLITNWSDDDSLDVLVNANTIVSMTKGDGNTFTATPSDATVGAGFNSGNIIYGVNNTHHDNITTALNGSQLKATLDFTGQNGTVSNLAKYDLMYGKGDPTGKITFNHKICVLRLDINSDSLKADSITSITDLNLKYVVSSGTPLFASKEVYNFGATCDSTITSIDSIYLNNTNITVTDGKATVYIVVPHRQNLYGTLYIRLKGSNGTTNQLYDMTNAISLSNGRMLMSTVHPQAITGLNRTKVNVGDYLFSDGSWGSLSDSIIGSVKPIAVIFSNTTSTIDKGHKWMHGYAMALMDACSGKWSSVNDNPTGTYTKTTDQVMTDKDGYTHTGMIQTTAYLAGIAATGYTAKDKSGNTVTVTGTSGWYLPSIGQWYDICANLGGMVTASGKPYTWYGTGANTGSLQWSSEDDGSGKNYSSLCASAINAYLNTLSANGYSVSLFSDTGEGSIYWCSSESSTTYANAVFFRKGLMMLGDYKKVYTTPITRPVIAF